MRQQLRSIRVHHFSRLSVKCPSCALGAIKITTRSYQYSNMKHGPGIPYQVSTYANAPANMRVERINTRHTFETRRSPSRIREPQVLFDKPSKYGKGLDWVGSSAHDAAAILLRYLLQLQQSVIPSWVFRAVFGSTPSATRQSWARRERSKSEYLRERRGCGAQKLPKSRVRAANTESTPATLSMRLTCFLRLQIQCQPIDYGETRPGVPAWHVIPSST